MNEMSIEGMVGEPLPYLLRSDGLITCIMFLCMTLVSYILANEKKYLYHQLKSFVSSRERASMFDEVTVVNVHYTVLLLLHACVLIGFCMYYYFSENFSQLFSAYSHASLLFGFILYTIVFLSLKMAFYKIVGWVFFQRERNMIWVNACLNVLIWMGFLLFPVVLLIVYFGLSPQTASYLVGGIIIFAKIALFCKCFSNFFGKIHGLVHLILYFCALEILPDLVVWKGIELVSNNLILNI